MFRLVILTALGYAAYRAANLIVEENQPRALLPAPSPSNRPPVGWKNKQASFR
jgi:hypothetical protein